VARWKGQAVIKVYAGDMPALRIEQDEPTTSLQATGEVRMKREKCPMCQGFGAHNGVKCPVCYGQKRIYVPAWLILRALPSTN
jgi:hypothetical protein